MSKDGTDPDAKAVCPEHRGPDWIPGSLRVGSESRVPPTLHAGGNAGWWASQAVLSRSARHARAHVPCFRACPPSSRGHNGENKSGGLHS